MNIPRSPRSAPEPALVEDDVQKVVDLVTEALDRLRDQQTQLPRDPRSVAMAITHLEDGLLRYAWGNR